MKLNRTLLACTAAAIALTACKKAAEPPPAPPAAPPPAIATQPAPIAGPVTTADGLPAQVLQQAEVAPLLADVPKEASRGTFVVESEKHFDGGLLIVDRLQFKPGAVLTFDTHATGRDLVIIAREVVSDDPQRPGRITYAAPQAGPLDAGAGQTQTSPPPAREGQAGAAGRAGDAGPMGTAGANAPNLTLIVLSITGGGPVIAFAGGPGVAGGQGRQGGDGAPGGAGRAASRGTFKCAQSAGDGAPGGAGGAGGVGGQGGDGGAGGMVTLLAPGDRAPGILQGLHVATAGGTPGEGGLAGKGGRGGAGGRGGPESKPFCTKSGRSGQAGVAGKPGDPGSAGRGGVRGALKVGAISQADFNRILGVK